MRATVAAVIALLSFAAGVPAANGTMVVDVERLAGADRYATAAAVAAAHWEIGARTSGRVVLARGDAFPDALASANVDLSTQLLTEGDRLSDATRASIVELDVESVTIVGGTAAVSSAVEDELRALGVAVERIAGTDRYETAVRTARLDGANTAYLASGERFADAVAVAPLAGRTFVPLVLTRRDALPAVTRQALAGVDEVIVVGGTAAVSDAVVHELVAMGIEVRRIAGVNRQGTAIALAELATQMEDPWTLQHVHLVRGDAFPDALAVGRFGGYEEAVTLLTESPTSLGADTVQFLRDHRFDIASLHVIGGEGAVSDAVLEAARDAATAGHDPIDVMAVEGSVGSTTMRVVLRHNDCNVDPEVALVEQTDDVVRVRGQRPPTSGVCNDVALESTFSLELEEPLGAQRIEVEAFVEPRTCTISGAPSDRCVAVEPS